MPPQQAALKLRTLRSPQKHIGSVSVAYATVELCCCSASHRSLTCSAAFDKSIARISAAMVEHGGGSPSWSSYIAVMSVCHASLLFAFLSAPGFMESFSCPRQVLFEWSYSLGLHASMIASLRSELVPPLLLVLFNTFCLSEGEMCVIVTFHQYYVATRFFAGYHLCIFFKVVLAIPNKSLVLAIPIAASFTVVYFGIT